MNARVDDDALDTYLLCQIKGFQAVLGSLGRNRNDREATFGDLLVARQLWRRRRFAEPRY